MSLEATSAIKGIFAVLILYSHIESYLSISENWYDVAFTKVKNYHGQLIVAMFFFYSGYGVMFSIMRKQNYAKSFFKNRIF